VKILAGDLKKGRRSILAVMAFCLCMSNAFAIQSAASLTHQDADVVSPDEPAVVALLPRLQRFDAEADPLTRCLTYPDPPNVHWPADVVTALCHHTFDKTITLDQIAGMIKQHRSAELSAIFAGYRKAQKTGKNPDALDIAFSRTFNNACKCARDPADAWLAQAPDNEYALVASGLQYAAAAGAARGTKFTSETPPENFARMSMLDAKADIDLQKALAIDPGLTPAIAEEALIAMREGHRTQALAWLDKGLSLSPDNFRLQDVNIENAMPRWGGSVPELNRAKSLALHDSDRNPMLSLAAVEVDVYLQECDGCKMKMRDFESTMTHVPILGSLRQAGISAVEGHNFPLGAVYLSEVMRFSPTSELWARTNRGIAWTYIGQFDAAQRDAETALALKPNYQPALQLSRMIEAFRAEAKALALEGQKHT
jgi:tetratricopeptide (TPR) repeat protein